MRLTAAVVAAAIVFGGGALVARHQGISGAPRAPRVPVLVELFTSEGCSSCPAADDLLRHLLEKQPIDGVEVIAISEHVDYWNRLGWRDPFSSAQFSERQSEYGRAFGSRQIYTPQMVVSGRIDAIGNDPSAVRTALIRAAEGRYAKLAISASRHDGGAASVRVVVSEVPAEAAAGIVDVVVAVVEDGLVTDVPRGENARKRLRHDAVVRALGPIATMRPASIEGEFVRVMDLAGSGSSAVRVVAFVQERVTRHVFGAASARLAEKP